ncbi:MAG: bifunctional glutamate N-acetyltransferase/amino-acid acetyltransferase ArgJ [Actinobacteria bacterium]|nr:MAG: bifunctional glutamate N-acetyltransferase/amino-acid acetyltransferase ArgJ [Actinomycetota bacterium]
MTVRVPIEGGITAPKGFRAAGVAAGIKKAPKKDVGLIVFEPGTVTSAVFTRNAMAAAPIVVSRRHLAEGSIRAIVANSGNANACTGDEGVADAIETARAVAREIGVAPQDVLVASTGVIGEPLDMASIELGVREAAGRLGPNSFHFAEAIMTTDTFPKEIAVEASIAGGPVRIGGVAKGSGMIQPDMATMLAFLTTDADLEKAHLQALLADVAERSFNMLTVDGETSTNDMVALSASGRSALRIEPGNESEEIFRELLLFVCTELARMIARDGEGATKLVDVTVTGAASAVEAKTAAMAVANSPLVKTALFASDPNWGRIAQAAGASPARLDPKALSISFGDIVVAKQGQGVDFDEARAGDYLKGKQIAVYVDLGVGESEATVWTCDFSYDYVKINAEYRT